MIIAIDGPAAAGKGTLARRVAAHFTLAYLDTGSLYRAVGLELLRAGADPSDMVAAEHAARTLDARQLADPDLRAEATGAAASKVAAIPGVRAALLEFQRMFARRPPAGAKGAVLDGRDIGTVVLPDADRKLFITASLTERARRRWVELGAGAPPLAEVERTMAERDRRDQERAAAPLKAAPDAFLLDTSDLDIDAAFAAAKAYISGANQ